MCEKNSAETVTRNGGRVSERKTKRKTSRKKTYRQTHRQTNTGHDAMGKCVTGTGFEGATKGKLPKQHMPLGDQQ